MHSSSLPRFGADALEPLRIAIYTEKAREEEKKDRIKRGKTYDEF